MPTKHNKCVVIPKLKHFDDIRFKELFGGIRVVFVWFFFFWFFLQNKICPFLRQGIYIHVGHSFFLNTVG
jgi:hypothetical protein